MKRQRSDIGGQICEYMFQFHISPLLNFFAIIIFWLLGFKR